MQVSIETTSGLERRLTITVPFERFEGQVVAKINETARRAHLPGFRPGRVPVNEIKRRFGTSIRAEVISDTMQTTFGEAVRQENLRPAGAASFDLANPNVVQQVGEDLKYTATFEVLPEIELKAFSSVAIARPTAEVTDADVERMIERLRVQRQTFVADPERAAEKGDQLAIDFEGSVDGEVFEGGTATDFAVVLGQGRLVAGFEDALVGARAGETRTFPVTFPEDYGNEQLRGKLASFTVTVREVRPPRLPEVDADFMRSFGVASGERADFEREVRESMVRELEGAMLQRVKNQVFDALASLHDPQLPQVMLSGEIERMRRDMLQRMGVPMELYEQSRRAQHDHDHDHAHDHDHDHDHAHDHDHDHAHEGESEAAAAKPATPQFPQLPDALFQDSAARRVRVGLVMGEIIRTRGLQPDDQKVRAMIRRIASAYDDPQSVENWYYSDENQLARIEQAALEEQVIDLIVAEAQVTDVATSYDEVIAPRSATTTAQADSEGGEA